MRDLKTVKGERGTRNKGKGRDVMFDQIVCVKNMRAIMHTKMVNGSAACLWSSEVRRRTTGHVMTLGMTIWKSADGMGSEPRNHGWMCLELGRGEKARTEAGPNK